MVGDGPGVAPAALLGGTLTALADGADHGEVACDWPELTLGELAQVLPAYPGLGLPEAVVWHSRRPFAASAIVRCAGGLVFVKRHDRRVRSVADLLEEHAFIAHLRARGGAVPAVLAASDGLTAVAGLAGTYEVHAPGQGEDAYRDAPSWAPARSEADAAALGHALGLLHRAAEGFALPVRRTRLIVAGDTLIRAPNLPAALAAWAAADAHLGSALAGRPWRADLDATLLGWHRAVQPHVQAMAPLWVHGDLHASNTLWRDGGVSTVLDFGLSNRASAVFDLATTIERNAVAWLHLAPQQTHIGRPDLACAVLRGYDRARPRAAAEIAALRHVLPLVHLDFALSELAYFHGVTGSTRDAAAAYDDFLLGHAAWFAGGDGRRFLDALS